MKKQIYCLFSEIVDFLGLFITSSIKIYFTSTYLLQFLYVIALIRSS